MEKGGKRGKRKKRKGEWRRRGKGRKRDEIRSCYYRV